MRPHLLNIVFSSAMGHCEFITMKIKICATNWMKTQFCLSIVEICGVEEGCGAVLLITRRGRPRSQQSIAGFHPNSIRIQKLEASSVQEWRRKNQDEAFKCFRVRPSTRHRHIASGAWGILTKTIFSWSIDNITLSPDVFIRINVKYFFFFRRNRNRSDLIAELWPGGQWEWEAGVQWGLSLFYHKNWFF